MLESLTVARHSLFDTTATNLATLTTKLEAVVSTLPASSHTDPAAHATDCPSSASDTSSETTDPAELFHRDIGIQTSSPASPALSSITTTSTSSPLATQASSLETIHTHLASLHAAQAEAEEAAGCTRAAVTELQTYLDEIRFGRRMGYANGAYGVQVAAAQDSAVEKVRKEIRSVKGVLLSAKSFPSGKR
jgi:hypothetical protein